MNLRLIFCLYIIGHMFNQVDSSQHVTNYSHPNGYPLLQYYIIRGKYFTDSSITYFQETKNDFIVQYGPSCRMKHQCMIQFDFFRLRQYQDDNSFCATFNPQQSSQGKPRFILVAQIFFCNKQNNDKQEYYTQENNNTC